MASTLRRRPRRIRAGEPVVVVGLGRFGSSLASALVELGHEVLGVDRDPRLVQRHANVLTHVVEADATDPEALWQLGAREFRFAVVGIGSSDLEASILTVSELADLAIPEIWAKAVTERHGEILRRVGATRVVFPEHDVGRQLAHLVTGHMLEYVEVDPGFALVETRVPASMAGRTLAELAVRDRWNVTVVCVKPESGTFTYATAETTISSNDILLVAGDTESVERFADET